MAVAAVGLVVVATTPELGDDPILRLRIVGVAMAAALAFVLDDHASTTLASSPMTLLERRAVRWVSWCLFAGLWWFHHARRDVSADAQSHCHRRRRSCSCWRPTARSGFAACVYAQRRSDDGSGGTAER